MKVLVVAASRYGSTEGIAGAIAQELQAQGIETDLFEADAAEHIANLEKYDAVVLGSAVYLGHWMTEASRFAEEHGAFLASVPLWLFSSGPAGSDENAPHALPEGITRLIETTGARAHRVFPGRLEIKSLNFGERLICKVMGAPEGDFRDWDAIREWARGIAGALSIRQPEGAACRGG